MLVQTAHNHRDPYSASTKIHSYDGRICRMPSICGTLSEDARECRGCWNRRCFQGRYSMLAWNAHQSHWRIKVCAGALRQLLRLTNNIASDIQHYANKVPGIIWSHFSSAYQNIFRLMLWEGSWSLIPRSLRHLFNIHLNGELTL